MSEGSFETLQNNNDGMELSSSSDGRSIDPVLVLNAVSVGDTSCKVGTGAGSGKSPMGSGGCRSAISSVCFIQKATSEANGCISSDSSTYSDSSTDSDSDSDDSKLLSSLRCHQKMTHAGQGKDNQIFNSSAAFALSLPMQYHFVSCHTNGESFLWDLGQQKIASQFTQNRGPGLALRRLQEEENADEIMYQTRDPKGIVSVHTLDHCHSYSDKEVSFSSSIVTQFETYSQTFCAAAPCTGKGSTFTSLLALPSRQDDYVTVRDRRINPLSSPVVEMCAAGSSENDSTSFNTSNKHGMLTSLSLGALLHSDVDSHGFPLLTCGMESGTVFFHDLRMLRKCIDAHLQQPISTKMKLSKDPLLALDMSPSKTNSINANRTPNERSRSAVVITGMAGDVDELRDQSDNTGTIAVMKATVIDYEKDESTVNSGEHLDNNSFQQSLIKAKLRSRLSTCKNISEDYRGKLGVSVCRFACDGRIFAVGGWEKRIRIFDRSNNNRALAILKGHSEGIACLDWAPPKPLLSTGEISNITNPNYLLASGASDGRICIWNITFSATTSVTKVATLRSS